MIISKINRNKQVQIWFFQNKSEQNCNVHTIHRFSAGLAGRTAGRQPDQAKHSRPAIKGKLPASLPLSKFFFSNEISTKSTFGSGLKIVKKCYLRGSFDGVRHFFPLFGRFGEISRDFFGGFWSELYTEARLSEEWVPSGANSQAAPKIRKTPAGSLYLAQWSILSESVQIIRNSYFWYFELLLVQNLANMWHRVS